MRVAISTSFLDTLNFDWSRRVSVPKVSGAFTKSTIPYAKLSSYAFLKNSTPVTFVALKLNTPWKDGATQIVLEPPEFMQRLAALVPRSRLHLTRFHGMLALNAKLRSKVMPKAGQCAVAYSEVYPCARSTPARAGHRC